MFQRLRLHFWSGPWCTELASGHQRMQARPRQPLWSRGAVATGMGQEMGAWGWEAFSSELGKPYPLGQCCIKVQKPPLAISVPQVSHWLSGAHSRPGGKVLCPWLGLRRWALGSSLILSSLQMHKFLTKVRPLWVPPPQAIRGPHRQLFRGHAALQRSPVHGSKGLKVRGLDEYHIRDKLSCPQDLHCLQAKKRWEPYLHMCE